MICIIKFDAYELNMEDENLLKISLIEIKDLYYL